MSQAVADKNESTVTYNGKTYRLQALETDQYTVLHEGIPVGKVVWTFGAPNGVPEGDALTEDDLWYIGEAWFAAIDG
jgi:hypothetical protein